MKSKKRVLITSLTAIALSAALIGGSTYALFTSQSKANIAVTSGKVEIVAEAKLTDAWSAKWDEATKDYVANHDLSALTEPDGYTFTNEGTVTIEDNVVTLERVTPGDGVALEISLKNNSNVAINYSVYTTLVKVEGNSLYDALTKDVEYPIGGDAVADADGWYHLDAYEQISDTIDVKLELPIDAGNEYQDTSCEIAVIVQAVQGNAHVEAITYANSSEQLLEALNADEGGTIELGEGAYKTENNQFNLNNDKDVTISGQGVGKTVLEGAISLFVGNEEEHVTYTIKGVTLKWAANGSTNFSIGQSNAAWADSAKTYTIILEDCVIEGISGQNVYGIQALDNGTIELKNVEFKNMEVAISVGDKNIETVEGKVKVSNVTFTGVTYQYQLWVTNNTYTPNYFITDSDNIADSAQAELFNRVVTKG